MKKNLNLNLQETHQPPHAADTGQAALVMVIGFTLLLTLFGGVMVNPRPQQRPDLDPGFDPALRLPGARLGPQRLPVRHQRRPVPGGLQLRPARATPSAPASPTSRGAR